MAQATASQKSFLAEALGTFILIFLGCATVISVTGKENGNVSVAMVFGLVLTALIYIFGTLSGAQFNPAVTGAMALDKRISYSTMGWFWLAQLLGALVAGALLLWIYGKDSGLGQSIGSFTFANPWKALIIEFLATFVLVLVILCVTANPQVSMIAGVVIGLTLLVGILFAFYFTGGSLNAWRTLAPALFAGNLSYVWIYIVAAILAALAAAGVYRFFFKSSSFFQTNALHNLP